MAALLKVPTTELRRVNDANARLVEVAQSLTQIAAETTDENIREDLYRQIEKLLDNVSAANSVLQAVTLAPSSSLD